MALGKKTGGRVKGLPKTGGRQKGSLNKVNIEVRSAIRSFMSMKFSQFEKSWNSLDDKEKCKTYVDLMKYAVPALQAIDYTNQSSKKDEVEELLREKGLDVPMRSIPDDIKEETNEE